MFLHLCITCEIFSTFLTHRVLNGAFFCAIAYMWTDEKSENGGVRCSAEVFFSSTLKKRGSQLR